MEKLNKNRVVISLNETTSTNSELKKLQQEKPLPEGSIVMADFQTMGRGQVGNSWFSGNGNNLLFSLLLYPDCVAAKDQFIISRIVSLALKRLLDNFIDNVTIKWPNDIYWNDKKVAGILIENSLIGRQIDYCIIGVGLNVNENNFPSALLNPISMKQVTGKEYDRQELLETFNRELFLLYRELQIGNKNNIESEYMQHLYRKDGTHSFEDKGGLFHGRIKDVISSGHLIIEALPEEEERIYAFKEVSFIV
ncbi:MAG: biotin--[acetyl-CoA-carboxylase] ligase [Dysgonamonadaceae bacterium]|nr:biotin--[acetyl-CoA-carboxylase] ligase [Dysgonamonadaceae bacterium]MDD4727607.1 biotin--[acetyl-CoA-carboxylase] ligase [Dysgonamonadaceae bacterium]